MLRFRNLIFQTAVGSTHRNRSFNPPYFRLLACVKCNVLHSQQFRWVLLCTWNFCYNMDLGRYETWPLRFLSVLSSTKNASWMISLWSNATWSYSGGISGKIVNSAGLDQVQLEWICLKCETSHSPWAYSREHSPWQVSAFDSHRYFPHQTRNKLFKMVLLTPECESKTTAMSE